MNFGLFAVWFGSWQYGALYNVFNSPSHVMEEEYKIVYDAFDKGLGIRPIARKYGVSPNSAVEENQRWPRPARMGISPL